MAEPKYNSLMHDAYDYVMIIFGLLLYGIGFCCFILPYSVVIGGMTGLGTLVYFATDKLVPVAVTMYTVNLLLIVSSYKILGRSFTIRTIFGATGASLVVGMFEGYFSSQPPLLSEMPMSLILGAIIMGLGLGTIFIHNGTSGGTDIVAAIATKKSNVSVGRTMMIFDMSLVALSFFLPFDGDLHARFQTFMPRIIYGWITIFVYSYITDTLITTNRQATQFTIFSSKWKEIADRVNMEAHRGVTVLDGMGWYSKHDVKILMVWCRKIESVNIFRIIKSVDPDAFISQGAVNGVYGKGFDVMKVRIKRKKNQ